MPDAQATEQQEQRYKTIAVRVEENLHTQLQFISDLAGTSLSEEVRQAILSRITAAKEDPKLIERAQRVREEIEREAAARTAAISGFMGRAAVSGAPTSKARRTTKTGNE
jgi:glycerol-3-phosphate dehydrogenase